MPEQRDIKEYILELVDQKAWHLIEEALTFQHPADLADIITFLSTEDRERVFGLIDDKLKPDVLAYLDGKAESEVLESLSSVEISTLVEDMEPDDAADVLADLSQERSEEVLELMEEDESEEVRELLKYDQESAGGIMTPNMVALKDTLSISAALEEISRSDQEEPIYNAYVIDNSNRLVGVIGLWEMLKLKERNTPLKQVAHEEIISATTDMDQEEVARTMSKYDLAAIPVVDSEGVLVGRITADDVMDVLEEEASEDIFRLAGSDDIELTNTTAMQACRARLPWLLITLGITFFSSLILKRFMLDLTEVLALSFFVPIVMAMCGSTGMQSSTLIIRGLSLRTLEGRRVTQLLGREILAGLVMGAICGCIMGAWAQLIIRLSPDLTSHYDPFYLALTASVALVTAMTFAAVFGAFVPIALHKCKVDPAVASGPFVTASNDIFALLIYYGTTLALISLYPTAAEVSV